MFTSIGFIEVQGTECHVTIRKHDNSPTGLQYKVVVTVPKRLLPNARRLSVNMPKASKPKHNIGAWVIDVGNALYRKFGFTYTYNPSVDKTGNNTTFTFFFSDCAHAKALGLEFSDASYNAALRWELQAAKEQYPAFISPYRRGV